MFDELDQEFLQELRTIDRPLVQRVLKEMERKQVAPVATVAYGRLSPIRWLYPYMVHRAQDRQIRKRPPKGISTGLPALDVKLRGGWQAGYTYGILGLPKAGKTRLMVNFLLNAALSGHTVALAEVEVQAEDIYEMMAAIVSGVQANDIYMGGVFDDNGSKIRDLEEHEWDSWYAALDAIAQLPIRIIEGSVGVGDIERELIAFEEEQLDRGGRQVDLLLVDYLQRLQGRGDRFDSIRTNSAQLRRLSQSFGRKGHKRRLAIVTALQANREVHETKDKRLQAHHIFGSSEVEKDLTHLIAIYRPAMFTDLADRQPEEQLDLDLLLNRTGSVARIHSRMWMPTGRLYPANKPPEPTPAPADEETEQEGDF